MTLESPDRMHLVVVGAAAGMGRWLCEHVLSVGETAQLWESVTLFDTAIPFPETPTLGFEVTRWVPVNNGGLNSGHVYAAHPNTVAIAAVPLETLPHVARWMMELLHPDALVIDTSHDRARALSAWGDRSSVGMHALFSVTAPSAAGQTFAVCTSVTAPPAWLVRALETAGGSVNVMTDEHHDAVMRTVQTASHQALLAFADVVGHSGLDLEHDLWANRTPVFELLLALAVRVLAPGQDSVTGSIQAADPADDAMQLLRASTDRLDAARRSGLDAYLESLREPFSGGLFNKIAQAGSLATSAVQSSRARIADVKRAGELIGVRSLSGESERLHVGRVVKVTPTSFTLTNVLIGARGEAALLSDSAAIERARRLGISGKERSVEFRLGRVDILSPAELDEELDAWLTTSVRGCKFLIPESISGASAVRVVQGVPEVTSAELISEEVRLGQREVVVRFQTRLDRDPLAVERTIISRIDEVFVWPDGVVLPLSTPPQRLGFLGPAGTFSDVACRQMARLVGAVSAGAAIEIIEFPDFATLVGAVEQGRVDLAVLPITNSSSGLVDLAAEVLSRASLDVTAGGVVDVPVRFDAYVALGSERDVIDGARVYSHPQGFRQCSKFVAAHRLTEIVCTSTAEACRMVAERGDGIALAATGMNDEFGLATARTSVGNLAGALTRFLVLGRVGTFTPPARADALLRTIWIIEPEAAGKLPLSVRPRFDEVLRGPSGRTLLVSTDSDRIPTGTPGTRLVATIPWSPRTPMVVIE
jgi:prephenate dehydratase/prephenate dehydrogenase/ferredoxin-fold anticodon binding domain-containing protein